MILSVFYLVFQTDITESRMYLSVISKIFIYCWLTVVAKADVKLQSSYRGAVTLRPILVELIISD